MTPPTRPSRAVRDAGRHARVVGAPAPASAPVPGPVSGPSGRLLTRASSPAPSATPPRGSSSCPARRPHRRRGHHARGAAGGGGAQRSPRCGAFGGASASAGVGLGRCRLSTVRGGWRAGPAGGRAARAAGHAADEAARGEDVGGGRRGRIASRRRAVSARVGVPHPRAVSSKRKDRFHVGQCQANADVGARHWPARPNSAELAVRRKASPTFVAFLRPRKRGREELTTRDARHAVRRERS